MIIGITNMFRDNHSILNPKAYFYFTLSMHCINFCRLHFVPEEDGSRFRHPEHLEINTTWNDDLIGSPNGEAKNHIIYTTFLKTSTVAL